MTLKYSDLTNLADSYFYKNLFNPYYSQRSIINWSAVDTQYDYADVTFYTPSGLSESVSTTGHGAVELEFIRKVFREIDNILDVEFVETSADNADITIISSYKDLSIESEPGVVFSGLARAGCGINQNQKRLSTVRWRDYTGEGDLSVYERKTIVHEIGHALGLTHPGAGGKSGSTGGSNAAWTQKDSIMSYNWVNGQVSQFFTPLDIQALQSIWKPEADPVTIGWPATSYFPAADEPISSSQSGTVQKLTTGINENDSSEVEEELVTLASQLINQGWKDYVYELIGADDVVDVFIDSAAKFKASSPVKKLGKSVKLVSSESEFAASILREVDELTGLSVNFVSAAVDADIVYSSLKMKKWENHIEDLGQYHHSVWQSQGKPGVLTEFEQVLITQSILTSLGMGWSETEELSTFDTVLSWNGEDYFGITQADAKGLQLLWGEA